MKQSIIAIDPGQSGGIAVYSAMNMEGSAIKMPATLKDISDYLKIFQDPVVYIEDVHAFKGQGVVSSFKFGRGFGGHGLYEPYQFLRDI